MAKQMTTSTTASPSHLYAYTVEEYEDASGKTARRWTRIGAAFPHKEGAGLNVELRALPVDGRIVLLPPDPQAEDASGGGDDSRDNGGTRNRRC